MLYFTHDVQGIFDSKRVRTEVDTMIEDLQLVDKKKFQSKNLSGGMKRKLRYVYIHRYPCKQELNSVSMFVFNFAIVLLLL